MTEPIEPAILPYLADLETAVANLQNTWRPDDPAYRADVYRQAMTSLSYAYFAYFHATPEHPDWAPLWNPVYTLQPNPDDIYVQTPIRGDLSYRAVGQPRHLQDPVASPRRRRSPGSYDDTAAAQRACRTRHQRLGIALGEDFEIVFSAERPAGHTGNWCRSHPAGGLHVLALSAATTG